MITKDGYEYFSSRKRGFVAWACYRLSELSLVVILGAFAAIILCSAERLQPFFVAALFVLAPTSIGLLAVGFVMARRRERIAENDRRYNVDRMIVIERLQESIFERDNPHVGGSDEKDN